MGNRSNVTDIASTNDAKPGIISVARPDLYTPQVGAHEATHLYQNTRNREFRNHADSLTPSSPSLSEYDYGGQAGLRGKSIADFNPEQQADIVGDFTARSRSLPAHPGARDLRVWDQTREAYEPKIRQLQDVPPAPTGILAATDNFLQDHGLGRPIETVSGILHPDVLNPKTVPPMVPSEQTGMFQRSKIVK